MELYFYTSKTCHSCKQIKPHVERICVENKIRLHVVDREENAAQADTEHIFTLPTMIIKDNGKEIRRKEGTSAVPLIEQFILKGK